MDTLQVILETTQSNMVFTSILIVGMIMLLLMGSDHDNALKSSLRSSTCFFFIDTYNFFFSFNILIDDGVTPLSGEDDEAGH